MENFWQSEIVEKFRTAHEADEFGRWQSFNNMRSAFNERRLDKTKESREYLALHLFAFLASWGMLRGSSFMLRKSYKYLISIISIICEEKYEQLVDFDPCGEVLTKQEYVDLTMDLISKISNFIKYTTVFDDSTENKSEEQNVSDVLVSKILLGTLCCVPAYDRYALQTFRTMKITQRLGAKSIGQIYDRIRNKKSVYEDIQKAISTIDKEHSAMMRVFDLSCWTCGMQIENRTTPESIARGII